MTNAAIQIKMLSRTDVPAEYQEEEGCIAFEVIEITYNFYGKQMTDTFDTKITVSGEQFVITGNGFIKDGFQVK